MVFLSTTLFGQNTKQQKVKHNTLLLKAKIEAFTNFLELNPSQIEDFTVLYTEYDKAMTASSAIHNKTVYNIRKLPANELTREKVRESVNAQLQLSENIIEIRRKYFDRFEQILSPNQMLRFFQKESSISNQVKKEYNKRQQEMKKQTKQ